MSSARRRNLRAEANALFEAGFIAAAATLAEMGLDDNPEDGRLWELLAAGRYAERDFTGAVAALEAASVFVPLAVRSQVMLADGYERLEFYESAQAISRFLAERCDLPVEVLPAIAAQMCRLGNSALAWRMCHRALAAHPDEADSYYALALVKQSLGQPAEALLPIINRALDLDPQRSEFRLAVVLLLDELNRPERAYVVARGFAPSELACMNCLCRLRRLEAVYARARDVVRRAACQQQIERLTRRPNDPAP